MRIYKESTPPTGRPAHYGLGTYVELTGDELAHAVRAYLYALGVVIGGASTVRVYTRDGDLGLCGGASMYVDPSGRVLHDGNEAK